MLRAAMERADELHSALLDRNRELEAAGYHTQVAVKPQSSLLFLIDKRTGARQALKRHASSAAEPSGLWQAGRQSYSTAELVGILEIEPERISPSALLRPVFQDFLLAASAIVGGPAEVAYFAQSAVLYERILGRVTPVLPRFSATLIEPAIGELLRKHELTLERVLAESSDSLAQLLAANAMPAEGKRKMAAAGTALDAELTAVQEWMGGLDAGLAQLRRDRSQQNALPDEPAPQASGEFPDAERDLAGASRPSHQPGALPRRGAAGARAGRGLLLRTLRLRTGGGDHLPSGWILHWTYGNVAVARAFSLLP